MLKDEKIRLLWASMIGNILEWYDLCLYGHLAMLMGKEFFEGDSPLEKLIISFGVFAVGFLMRPLGAIYFGKLGDTFGRKKALALSMLYMAVSTLIISVLPSVDKIGIWASIILIICRLVQGFSAGGEYNGSSIFLAEHFGLKKASFYGSLVGSSGAFGMLLALLASLLVNLEIVPKDFWRLFYFVGSLIGVVGIYIRKKIKESPEIEEYLDRSQNDNLDNKESYLYFLQKDLNLRKVLSITFIAGACSSMNYVTFIYMPIFLSDLLKLSKTFSLVNVFFLILIIMITQPFIGAYADKIGPCRFLYRKLCLLFILIFPLFYIIGLKFYWGVILASICLALLTASLFAPLNAFFISLFPVNRRYLNISFYYNLGAALMGGTAPMIVTKIYEKISSPLSPAIYVFCLTFLSIIIARKLLIIKEK